MKFLSEENKTKIVDFFQKYWIPIVGTVIVLAVIVSVISIYREEVLEIKKGVEYEEQDEIILVANSLDTLNPITSLSEDTYYISKLLYDGLFEYNDNFGVEPNLIDSYTVDTEKGTVEFKLKSGLSFHDGSAINVDDIRFTVSAIKSFGEEGQYYEKASKISSVSTGRDGNIKITFSKKDDCALDNLTFPIVSNSQYSSVAAFNEAKNFEPVGSGQYKYESFDALKLLVMTPNEAYHGDKAVKNVSVQIIPDKSTSANLVEVGNLTCYYEKGSQRKSDVTNKGFKMYDLISNEVEFLYLNNESKLLKSKNVRKAIAYAIDSEGILEKGYMGDGVLCDTIYYPNFLGISDEHKSYKYNEEKALELLKKVGIEDRDFNGKLEKVIDKKAKTEQYENAVITILVNNDNANRLAAAKLISKNLESIGFTVNITELPFEEYQEAIKNTKSYDILITGFIIEEGYDLRSFFNGENLWGYENEELLAQVSELEKLYDAEQYGKYYEKFKTSLLKELPYYPICYKKMGLIGTEGFEINEAPTFNNIYKNIETWKWSKVIEEK